MALTTVTPMRDEFSRPAPLVKCGQFRMFAVEIQEADEERIPKDRRSDRRDAEDRL